MNKTEHGTTGVLPPFALKVIDKLQRFFDCAEDFESGGVDIGRDWLDTLTHLGLLERVQRSPALWQITEDGDALLAAAPAQPAAQSEFGAAYQGAREDLAIWKRRALEAEEKVRNQEQIIDRLTLEAQGESRMGEPVIPAATAQSEVQRLREALPYLRNAVAEASASGVAQLAVVSTKPDGSGKLVCKFECVEFMADLAAVVGAGPQTEDDDARAEARKFLQRNGIASTGQEVEK